MLGGTFLYTRPKGRLRQDRDGVEVVELPLVRQVRLHRLCARVFVSVRVFS